jgi:heparosan-N-sulfate-glucuronate 5-epimerase
MMKFKYLERLLGRDHFPVAAGSAISYESVRGYYIDLTRKAVTEPGDAAALEVLPLHVITIQWGLGCHERFLAGDGDQWLDSTHRIGCYIIEQMESGGRLAGALRHRIAFPHTFRLQPGWISGMAQGEAASLFVRLYVQFGDERFAEAALRALGVLEVSVQEGGVCRYLKGGPIHEEYPTDPASHVLNGAIFAAWGCYDVALALGESRYRAHFDAVASTIADNIDSWDLGFWSRYDLYPHRIDNAAAPWYHRLHIQQLGVLDAMTGRRVFGQVAQRWQRYADSGWNRSRALLHKAAFRVAVPL